MVVALPGLFSYLFFHLVCYNIFISLHIRYYKFQCSNRDSVSDQISVYFEGFRISLSTNYSKGERISSIN